MTDSYQERAKKVDFLAHGARKKMAAIPGNNSMIPSDNVVMGVPKKGRLYDRCMKLLAGAGMDHRRVRGKPCRVA